MNRRTFSSRLSPRAPHAASLVALLALAACSDDATTDDNNPPIILAGSSGASGAAGSTGGAGHGGTAGTAGSSGVSGSSGHSGSAGKGGAGASGAAGKAGAAGAAGKGGDAGTAGAAGDTGTAGTSSGAAGDTGTAGDGGAAGDSGAGGAAGDTGGPGGAGTSAGGTDAGQSGSSGQPAGGTAGAGGTDGTAGAGGTGPGGTAGQGGAGAGPGGSAGAAGQSGAAGSAGGLLGGAAGAAGLGGAAGSSGSSGQAGAAGQGGAGGATGEAHLVAVLGRGQLPAESVSYAPSSGWTAPTTLSLSTQGGSLAPYKNGAVAMVRRASQSAAEQDELYWATWTPAKGFGAFAKVGVAGFAIGGPSLASSGSAVEATFFGQNHKDYTTQLSELGTFAPFSAFPGGQAGSQAFGQSAIKLAPQGSATWAAYAGDDGGLYYSSKAGPGSTWSFSSKAPSGALVPTITPDVQAYSGGVTFAYVLSANKRIALDTLIQPQNSWAGEQTVGDSAITGSSPALLRLGASDYLVVWHGLDDQGIYFARGGAGKWSAPQAILPPSLDTSSAPLVLAGVGADKAEVLFTRGGTLRHARYDGTSFTVSEVATTSSSVTLGATLVPAP